MIPKGRGGPNIYEGRILTSKKVSRKRLAVMMKITKNWQTADKHYVVFNDETVIEG